MQETVRILLSLSVLLAVSACCTEQVVADFTTPASTLTTFQEAYRSDMPELEYECFGLDFKERIGSLDLDRYIIWRNEALEDEPFLNAILNLKDLAGCTSEPQLGPDGRTASLLLTILSQEIRLFFIRETTFRLEFDEGLRPVECQTEPLYPGLLEVDGKSIIFKVNDLRPRWIRQLPRSRKLVVEECWKFDGFFFPQEDEDGTSRPIE